MYTCSAKITSKLWDFCQTGCMTQSVRSKVKMCPRILTRAHWASHSQAQRIGGHLPPRALQVTGHLRSDSATCPTGMTPPHGQQHKRTSLPNGLPCLPPHQGTVTSGTSSGQLAEERPRFMRPTSPDFHANDHKLGPRGVRGTFSPSSALRLSVQPHHDQPLRDVAAIAVQRANQCRVHSQLSTSPQWQSVHHHLQPSAVVNIRLWKVHVSDHDVGAHSPLRFPADPGQDALHRETPSIEHPCLCTRSPMMAKSVDSTATSTPTCAQRKCLAEASQLDDSEEVRRQRRFLACRRNRQRGPGPNSSLRPDESLHLSRCLCEELLPELPLCSGASFMLPSPTNCSWFCVLKNGVSGCPCNWFCKISSRHFHMPTSCALQNDHALPGSTTRVM